MTAGELRYKMGNQYVSGFVCKAIEKKIEHAAIDGLTKIDITYEDMLNVECMEVKKLDEAFDRVPECVAMYFKLKEFHVSYMTLDGHTVFHFDWSYEF